MEAIDIHYPAYTAFNIKLGDRITFKAITRCSDKQATRIVNGFDYFDRPTVRYGGCGDFVVRLREISQVRD